MSAYIGSILAFGAVWLLGDRHAKRKSAAIYFLRTIEALPCDQLESVCWIYSANHSGVKRAAYAKLLQMLSQIDEGATIQTGYHTELLLHHLMQGNDRDMVLALIRIVEFIGDEKEIPFLTNLAEGKYLAAKDADVREHARKMLPLIKTKAEFLRNQQSLLRPATSGETATSLLRPAHEPTDADPDTLLRSSPDSPDDESKPDLR